MLPADTVGSVPDEPGPLATQGWQRLAIGENSLLLPPGWRSLPLEEAALEQQASAGDPALAEAIRKVVDGGLHKGATQLAVDPQFDGGSISLTIVVQDRPRDRDELGKSIERIMPLAGQNKSVKLLDSHAARRVKGMPSTKMVFDIVEDDHASSQTHRVVLWMIYSRTHFYALIFHGPASLASGKSSDYSDVTEEIALSLTLADLSEGDTNT